MTNKSKIKIISIFVLFLIPLFFTVFTTLDNGNNKNSSKNVKVVYNKETDQIEISKPKSSKFWNLGSTIRINDTDPTEDWAFINSTYDWCNGKGTWDDPYVIENVTIDMGGALENGIDIMDSNVPFIINNVTILDGSKGIQFNNANNSKILNSVVSIQNFRGIYLYDSHNNTIEGNYVENTAYFGIRLHESNNNWVSHNEVTLNTRAGLSIKGGINNTFISNIVNLAGWAGIYLYGEDDITINNCIINNTISNDNYRGIWIWEANNTEIRENTVKNNNWHGISIDRSNHTEVINNTFNFNDGYGIRMNYYGKSHYNTVMFNNFTGNIVEEIIVEDTNGPSIGSVVKYNMISGYWVLEPFYIDDSETGVGAQNWTWAVSLPWISGEGIYNNPYVIRKVSIDGNNVSTCLEIMNSNKYLEIMDSKLYNSSSGQTDAGLRLNSANNTMLYSLNISNNNANGIYFKNSRNSTVMENMIKDNTAIGLTVDGTSDNCTIYLNWFINNSINAMDNGTNIRWDNGSIGNFWRDYTGKDANDNYIGDTPYNITGSANSQDRFPIWSDGIERHIALSSDDDDDDDGGSDRVVIPFGNYFLFFVIVSIISLIAIIRRRIVVLKI